MDNRIKILSELQSISRTVAGIAPVNPYRVPEGYFQNLPLYILGLAKEPGFSVLASHTVTPYIVPEGYFENLPGQILAFVKNTDSRILKNKQAIPYQVPTGYFDTLAENVLRRVKVQENVSSREELESLSPLLSKLNKVNPFTLPDGYFDDLSGNVVEGMKAVDFVNEELENLSPLMNSLKGENAYEVPAGYFHEFPALILSKVKEKKPSKLISMNFGKKAFRYAAAAVVFAIVVTAGLLFMNRQNESVNPKSIVQTEEKIHADTQNELKELTDDELLNFIESQSAPLPDIINLAASDELDEEAVQLMLADIPDAELKRYLIEYGDTKEVITN